MKFNDLKLHKQILKALREAGYEQPTPIQQQAIPPVLEGRDLLGCCLLYTSKIGKETADEKGSLF